MKDARVAGNLPGTHVCGHSGHASIFTLILQNLGTQLCTMQSDAQTVAPEVRQMPCSGDRRKHTHTQCSQSEMIETLHTYALSVKATKASGEDTSITPQSPRHFHSSAVPWIREPTKVCDRMRPSQGTRLGAAYSFRGQG